MKYFDQHDSVQVDIDSKDVLLITNHGPGTEFPNLKFSVRRWWQDKNVNAAGEHTLGIGKGITIYPEQVSMLLKALVEAIVRAEIPMDDDMWEAAADLIHHANEQNFHPGHFVELIATERE